jgi:hypothetical protein
MGVTCHWLDDKLKREDTVLALRRVKGRHTYDVVAKVIHGICREYGIQNKVERITTDSASNFVKAFK